MIETVPDLVKSGRFMANQRVNQAATRLRPAFLPVKGLIGGL
jgi:hypothetical protein